MKKLVYRLMLVSFFCMIVQSKAVKGKEYYLLKLAAESMLDGKESPSVDLLFPSDEELSLGELLKLWENKSPIKELLIVNYSVKLVNNFVSQEIWIMGPEEKNTKISQLYGMKAFSKNVLLDGLKNVEKWGKGISLYEMKKDNKGWKATLIFNPVPAANGPKVGHIIKLNSLGPIPPLPSQKNVTDNVHWIFLPVISILFIIYLAIRNNQAKRKKRRVKKNTKKKRYFQFKGKNNF